MIDKIEKIKCTGCKMCGDICPYNAIEFEVDNEGFWFPIVNQEKCVKCGLCIKKCPSLSNVISDCKKDPIVYAAWSLDDKIRYNSTSGGIYYEIGRYFIEKGAYIAGCIYSEDYKSAMHIVGNTMADLKRIMGSKYFQSDTQGIYNSIKELINKGEDVLFCGTPCQVAAVRSFFIEKPNNLYLLDFICKGINSPKAYKAYVEELEHIYGAPITSVRLKSKKTGWESLATNIVFENGCEYHKDRYTDWWIQGYTCGNLFMRETCQECQYKTLPRLSDITFGDFWGIERCSEQELQKGISVVFANSDEGVRILEELGNRIHLEQRLMDEVLAGNPYLFGQAKQLGNRQKFFELLNTMSFSNAVKATYTETNIEKTKRYIKYILKKYFKRRKW